MGAIGRFSLTTPAGAPPRDNALLISAAFGTRRAATPVTITWRLAVPVEASWEGPGWNVSAEGYGANIQALRRPGSSWTTYGAMVEGGHLRGDQVETVRRYEGGVPGLRTRRRPTYACALRHGRSVELTIISHGATPASHRRVRLRLQRHSTRCGSGGLHRGHTRKRVAWGRLQKGRMETHRQIKGRLCSIVA